MFTKLGVDAEDCLLEDGEVFDRGLLKIPPNMHVIGVLLYRWR